MNGVPGTISPVSKRSTSPRPPAIGEEVKKFHDTSQHHPELYKNWNMECQSKIPCSEPTDCSFMQQNSTEKVLDSTKCFEDSSNTSPPACYKWAQSLQCLLEDIQGVALFQKFLKQEGQDTRCLSFWFACRGVKKNDSSDREALVKLIKVVFEKKVERISAISDETKEEIRQRLAFNKDIDDTIFDKAQLEVEEHMMKTTFPNFLKSDLYIQHLRGWQNEQSHEKERAVSPEFVESLPTVHEDSELQIGYDKYSLPKANVLSRNKISSISKFKPEGPAGFLQSPYNSYSNYHSRYGSYLPASAQDSELQSMSSDAQTDDTMSLTDASSADFPVYSRSKQKHQQKISKHSAIVNKEKFQDKFIPRTKRVPLESAKPLSPMKFYETLVKKLNKVLEERRTSEKMVEKLKTVEGADYSRSEIAPYAQPSHKPNAPVMESGFLCPPMEENVQDILDQHISRVFEDSGQHTPRSASECMSPPAARPLADASRAVRSSSCCEPPEPHPMAALHKHSHVSQYTGSNSMKCRRDHDAHSIDSAMFDYVSDDNNQPIDFSRRCKEQSRRNANKKSSFSDSGISSTSDSVPSYSKVTNWLEAKRISEQEREQYLWRNSSTSPVLSRSSSNRKTIGYSSYRNGNPDVGCSQWSGAPSQLSQDLAPLYPPIDTTSNLMEARRRLEDDNKTKLKMKYASGGRNTCDTPRTKLPKGYDSYEDNSSHRKQNRKYCSINMLESATVNAPCNDVTVIGYSYGRHSVPYLSKYPGKNITLRQFKSVISKKGDFKYFFKKESNELGTGVVFEEVTDDHKVLPLWEGKVFCVIETIDNGSV